MGLLEALQKNKKVEIETPITPPSQVTTEQESPFLKALRKSREGIPTTLIPKEEKIEEEREARKIAEEEWRESRRMLPQLREQNRLAKEKRVIIWGAGRIFDLMLKAGLNREALGFVVDKYLPDITRPNELQEAEIGAIDLLIIASREYAKEIEQEARGLGFECEVKVWSELE